MPWSLKGTAECAVLRCWGMTTSAVGRVVDEHDVGLQDPGIVLHDALQQLDVKIKEPSPTIGAPSRSRTRGTHTRPTNLQNKSAACGCAYCRVSMYRWSEVAMLHVRAARPCVAPL